jgi:glycine/D-amino acid oxidase-like deaminating enzyme
MAPAIYPVDTSVNFPPATTVVVIGAGIVGLSAALTLAERGIRVVVFEKGRLAGEQSSRNLGWVRKTNRNAADVPLARAADRLWDAMPARTGMDVGFRRAGIMFVASTAAQLSTYETWLASVEGLGLDSRILSSREIATLVPGGSKTWIGALYTPSDARAEPTLACSAIAKAAIARGVVIVENCAVRNLSMTAGKVSGVVTEHGEIACEQVLLAGGLWSRRFLGNLGISLATLPLICSVMRTTPMEGPTEIAVGAENFSFRKRLDGGFTLTQRGRLEAPLTFDHLRIGLRYIGHLRRQRGVLKIGIGRELLRDAKLARRWQPHDVSPFEEIRTMDPAANSAINSEALENLRAAWPVFRSATIAESWAGMIDVTPDSEPVIAPIPSIPGLVIATGFSGHGFGTGPAAGHLAADLISGDHPIVDPSPYRFERLH